MEQMPHHREGIQNELDKAYDEGHRDNEAFDEEQAKIQENEKAISPELAETIASLKEAGYLDTSFEGKEVHELVMRALSREEAFDEFKKSRNVAHGGREIRGNAKYLPYHIPESGILNVMCMKMNNQTTSSSSWVLEKMEEVGVRPLTLEELIQYAVIFPEDNELIALNSMDLKTPVLEDGNGDLKLISYYTDWYSQDRFLVTPK